MPRYSARDSTLPQAVEDDSGTLPEEDGAEKSPSSLPRGPAPREPYESSFWKTVGYTTTGVTLVIYLIAASFYVYTNFDELLDATTQIEGKLVEIAKNTEKTSTAMSGLATEIRILNLNLEHLKDLVVVQRQAVPIANPSPPAHNRP